MVIHIATPLAGLFMCPVLLIELVAKIRNIPLVLDIRAGMFIKRYVKYNKIRDACVKAIQNEA